MEGKSSLTPSPPGTPGVVVVISALSLAFYCAGDRALRCHLPLSYVTRTASRG